MWYIYFIVYIFYNIVIENINNKINVNIFNNVIYYIFRKTNRINCTEIERELESTTTTTTNYNKGYLQYYQWIRHLREGGGLNPSHTQWCIPSGPQAVTHSSFTDDQNTVMKLCSRLNEWEETKYSLRLKRWN